jgi:flagellar motility protein MotE (MotC chaperone)
MIRALPFLIIFMVMMIGSKILEVLDVAPDRITQHVQAAEQPKTEEKIENTPQAPKDKSTQTPTVNTESTASPVMSSEEKKEDLKSQQNAVLYSPTEVAVLQELSKRRTELDQREKQLNMRQNTLNMLEQSIQQKLEQLTNLQQELQLIVAEYEKYEDEKTIRLVRIYEAMKPNEAAQIFEKLEDAVLLDVASKMKEAKLALILAKMDPTKAKELTMELANRRRVQSDVVAPN